MNTRKVLAFSVGPIGAAFLGLITLPIVAWLFSPEDIGRLTMLQVTISFSLLLFGLGLDQAYVREFHEMQDKPGLLKAVVAPGLVVLSLGMLGVWVMPWSTSELLFGMDSVWLTVLLFVSIWLSFFSRFLGLILRMQERGLAYSMSQLLPKLLFLLIVLGYVWFGSEAIFDNLMMANVIALTTVFIVYAWNTRKDWFSALRASVDRTKQSRMIKYAIPLIGSGLAFWGLTTMDKFFLRSLAGFEELGIYAVAVTFAGAALVFQAIFSTVWAPTVYKWAAEGVDPQKIKNVIDYVTLAVISIWALAGMFSWVLVYILPPGYNAVPYILLAAMAYPLLYTLAEATGIGVGIKRKTMHTLLAAIGALIVNAIGNWFLIPFYGAAGAALASAIAFMLFFVIRTESSAILWMRFESKKMYSLIVIMIMLSFVVNLWSLDKWWVFGIYLFVFLKVLFVYQIQVKGVLRFLKYNLEMD